MKVASFCFNRQSGYYLFGGVVGELGEELGDDGVELGELGELGVLLGVVGVLLFSLSLSQSLFISISLPAPFDLRDLP